MATNTLVLIVVAATAMLVLAGMIAGVAYKTRTTQRHVDGETLRDQPDEVAASREQLNGQTDSADKFGAAARTREMPQPGRYSTLRT